MAAELTFGKGDLTALVVAPSTDVLDALRRSPAITTAFSVLGSFNTYPAPNILEIRLRQMEPSFVLIDVATNLPVALELLRHLSTRKPSVLGVAVDRRQNAEAVVGALRAGACEYLSMPFDETACAEALARLHRLRPAPESLSRNGTVIVFTTAKPGAGSSTLATHVAHTLRREQSRRVLLMDLDLDAGTAGFYLKLSPSGSIRDLLGNETPTAGDWARIVTDSQGLHVLAAPDLPYKGTLAPELMNRLMTQAASRYEWVVVDAPNVFQPASLMAISESNLACLVTTPDLASLHLTRRAITLLNQLGLDKSRYRVVLNRMSRRESVTQQDIERMFQSEVFGVVPNEYFSLHRAISLGQTLPGDGDLGRAIANLSRRIAEAQKPAAEKVGAGKGAA